MIGEPLFCLAKKNKPFLWEEPQHKVIDEVKRALTIALVLKPINYKSNSTILQSVDLSILEQRAILQ